MVRGRKSNIEKKNDMILFKKKFNFICNFNCILYELNNVKKNNK